MFRYSDSPASAGTAGAGGVVSVEDYVLPSGRVSKCHITQSSGNQALDETTCRLITERYRYEPSRTANGTPVRSIIVADHEWIIDDSMLKALRKQARSEEHTSELQSLMRISYAVFCLNKKNKKKKPKYAHTSQ